MMGQTTLTPRIGQVQAWLDVIGGPAKDPYFVYHRGHLAFDRGQWVEQEDGQFKWIVAGEVNEIGDLMWEAHERGEVVLTQRRLARRDYLYVAQRSLQVRRNML